MSVHRGGLDRLIRQRDGSAAVEFAFIIPIFILLLLAGAEYGRAMSLYRKVTLTTRAVADLSTQYIKMSNSDVATVLNASSQIMAPYDNTNLTIILSDISTNASGVSTVSWSRAFPATATPLKPGQVVTLPAGSTQPGTTVILGQVSYDYTPTIGAQFVKPLQLKDQISMSPRLVADVTLTGS